MVKGGWRKGVIVSTAGKSMVDLLRAGKCIFEDDTLFIRYSLLEPYR